VKFLSDVSRILPLKKIIFILDEFDELPLSLYKRSEIGDALFLTIRSISGKLPYGFVLVGSEKLHMILNYQGERLNKFAKFDIDYFDKDKEWGSYAELVRKPVQGWLEIDDAAIISLHGQTAGNPFFTKLVCRELFSLMVSRRDRHVTIREMEDAIVIAINSASTVNFQHFWDDGIFDSGDKKEETSLKRRKMLIAYADSAHVDGSVGRNELMTVAATYGVDSIAFDEYLHEFQNRHIWLIAEGFVTCKVPFFSRWLRFSGVKNIVTSILDPEAAISHRRQHEGMRVAPTEIVGVVSNWSIFKGSQVTEDKVRSWLAQFGSDLRKQRLMFRLLERVRFYNAAAIRAKMKEAQSRISAEPSAVRSQKKRGDILLSYVDAPGKSGVYYAKTFADENNIYINNVVDPANLVDRISTGGFSVLLFVDDFLGSGTTASKGLQRVLSDSGELINRSGVKVVFFALCGFDRAKISIQKAVESYGCDFQILVSDILDETDRAFSDTSSIFDSVADRDDAKTIAYAQGKKLEPRCPLGYSDSQALVVFDSSCPNNSLPILWSHDKDWLPLFRRN
jgi:hypothetical protein